MSLKAALVVVSVQIFSHSIIVNAPLFQFNLITINLNLIRIAEWSLCAPDVVVFAVFHLFKNIVATNKIVQHMG